MGSTPALISHNLLRLSSKPSFFFFFKKVESKTGGFSGRGKSGFLQPSSTFNKTQLTLVKAALSLFNF